MASNPPTQGLPRAPNAGPSGGGGNPTRDEVLADLRRQLGNNAGNDSASDASSYDSNGRRRRRRRNNRALTTAGGALPAPAVLPRLAETKPVRLQLGLNLDVEVELKARLVGDVSLTLL